MTLLSPSFRGLTEGAVAEGAPHYELASTAGTEKGDFLLFVLFITTEEAITIPGLTVHQDKHDGLSFVFAVGFAEEDEPTLVVEGDAGHFRQGFLAVYKDAASIAVVAGPERSPAEGLAKAFDWPTVEAPRGHVLDVLAAVNGEPLEGFPALYTPRVNRAIGGSLADRLLLASGPSEAEGTTEEPEAPDVFRLLLMPTLVGPEEGSGAREEEPADPAFSLVPLEVGANPEEALAAAEASVFDDPFAAAEESDPPTPFGRSWAFDYQNGRFYRSAGAPAETRGLASLVEYIQTAMRTAAGAHPIFPPNFGIERPEDFLGAADPTEALSDFEDRLKRALLAHDRIEDVREFEATVDLNEGIITVTNLLIVTDQEEVVPLGPTNVELEG